MNFINKTALVVGFGTFGKAIATELKKNGWKIRILVRNKSKYDDWENTACFEQGDCSNYPDVKRAAKDVDLIVYAANPEYHKWHEQALKMLKPSIQVAQEDAKHLLFPGNVYSYDPKKSPMVTEDSSASPVNDKGELRVEMERMLSVASKKGAKVTVIRCGDFIAKGEDSSWINHFLSKRWGKWSLANPSSSEHIHCYTWMPSMAANAVAIVKLDKPGFNVWNEPGINLSHDDWLHGLRKQGVSVKSKNFPWWGLSFLSLFHPIFKEIIKMRYLWACSLQLDGTKLKNELVDKFTPVDFDRVVESLTAD